MCQILCAGENKLFALQSYVQSLSSKMFMELISYLDHDEVGP